MISSGTSTTGAGISHDTIGGGSMSATGGVSTMISSGASATTGAGTSSTTDAGTVSTTGGVSAMISSMTSSAKERVETLIYMMRKRDVEIFLIIRERYVKRLVITITSYFVI